eukprot:493589-Amphidinium_carterae.1
MTSAHQKQHNDPLNHYQGSVGVNSKPSLVTGSTARTCVAFISMHAGCPSWKQQQVRACFVCPDYNTGMFMVQSEQN